MGDGVFEGEGWGLGSGFQDAVFDAGVEEVFGGLFGDGEAFGLDEGAGVLGDAVELVLQRLFCAGGHGSPPYLKCVKVFEAETLALDFEQKTAGLNVAVRPKPDCCDG